jgi:hypothetical protein
MDNVQFIPGWRESLTVDAGNVKVEVTHLPNSISGFTWMTGIRINLAALFAIGRRRMMNPEKVK